MSISSLPRAAQPTSAPLAIRTAVNLGLTGAAIAIIAAWAAQIAGAPSAFESVAEAIMARTPPEFANRLLATLGILARPAALLGAVAVYLAIGATASAALALRTRLPLRRLISLLASLGAAAAAAHWLALPPVGWLVAVGGAALACLLDPNRSVGATAQPATAGLRAWEAVDERPARGRVARTSRRSLLAGSAGTAAVVLVAANAVFLSALARAVQGARAAGARLFAWSPPAARVAGFDIPGLSAEVTPAAQFYTMSKNVDDPAPRSDSWQLRIDGVVQQTLSLDYTRLIALPRTDEYVTLRCISNDVGGHLMSTALFSGVPLVALLRPTTPRQEADTLVMHGVDGHLESVPLALALHPDALVAYAMNGEALGKAHGFPARILLPGLYGFKQVKWLTRLELAHGPRPGHWEQLGWAAEATVNTVARIDVVKAAAGGALAAGVAYAGDRGIRAVQVRVDSGAWQPAVLNAPPLSGLTWVQWQARLPLGRGLLEARAIDGNGTPQEETPRSLFPGGAAGLDRVRFEVS